MSVLRPKPPEDPISLHLGPLADAAHPRLAHLAERPRDAVAASFQPGQLLDDYMHDRPSSELFQTLRAARELREAVDAVAVVCEEPIGHLVQGLFETCCHPFHNALSRGERGGRPRLYFDVGPPDTDRTAGLLDLLGAARGSDLLDCWGVVRIASGGPATLSAAAAAWETAVAAPQPAAPLRGARRSLRLSAPAGPGADGFPAAVLLVASAAGIDVVRFLGGGVAMQRRFLESPADSNPPLLLAAALQAVAGQPQPSLLMLDSDQATATAALARWWACQAPDGGPGPHHRCVLKISQPRRELRPSTEPIAAAVPSVPPPTIVLPRLDEHTVGQLVALRLLAGQLLAREAAEA